VDDERQLSLFEFVTPNEIERGEIPSPNELKDILTLGLLSTFTTAYNKPSDRNKAAEVLGKLHGLFIEKKDISLTSSTKTLDDFYTKDG